MEIKANELRLNNKLYKFCIDYIGNNPIVDRNDFVIVDVDLDVIKNIQEFDGTTNFDYYEGVPLTEEILLKCGFEKMIVENYPIYIFDGFMIELYTDCCVVCYNNVEITKITYLHTLQNLIFALTNQELEINL